MRRVLLGLVLSCIAAACVMAFAHSSPEREDCARYTPSTIRIVDRGHAGWLLQRADGAIFAHLDNRADAEAALTVAKRFSAICYIGRDNKRSEHDTYVMTYWK